MSMSSVPPSLGFSFNKNFYTCPMCKHECKNRHHPEKFSVDFNVETYAVNVICNLCKHHWEVK